MTSFEDQLKVLIDAMARDTAEELALVQELGRALVDMKRDRKTVFHRIGALFQSYAAQPGQPLTGRFAPNQPQDVSGSTMQSRNFHSASDDARFDRSTIRDALESLAREDQIGSYMPHGYYGYGSQTSPQQPYGRN